ncbi:MAG: hypothetical protein ABI601_20715 [bacterium]
MNLSMQMIGKTVCGKGWLLQLAAVVAAVVGFRIAGDPPHSRETKDPARNPGRIGWRVAALSAVGLALSLALSGHAASAPKLRTRMTAFCEHTPGENDGAVTGADEQAQRLFACLHRHACHLRARLGTLATDRGALRLADGIAGLGTGATDVGTRSTDGR